MSSSDRSEESLRILHLEDNDTDAELARMALSREWARCRIVRVGSKEAFLAALGGEPFDIILSDYTIPGFGGIQALDIVRERQPRTPYLFLSGTIGEENAVEALKRGATDYINKDRPIRLIPAVRRALDDVRKRRRLRQTEEDLRETQERFLQLAEQSGDVFWFASVDPERMHYVSPAFERIWGVPVGALYLDGRAWLRYVHPRDRSRVAAAYESWIGGTEPKFEEEYRVVRPDGTERWVLGSGTAIHDADGRRTRISGIAKDVTERKIAEREALRAQRLDSVGLLAGGIAHDLNNALAPILMSVQLLREKIENPDSQRMIDMIEKSSQHCAGLVRQVLAFARGVDGERAYLLPGEVIKEVVKLLTETLPRSIAIESDLESGPALILSNSTQIGQVLMNLGINARDAMPDGGSLRISTANVFVDETLARAHPGAKTGPHVRISVTDTGCGMPPEVLDKIFDPFFTTKADTGKGTGLGLSTVVGIVKSHGGFLEVESKVAIGTEFRIFFPAVSSAPAAEAAKVEAAPAPGKGETLLVIDDEDFVREVTKAILQAGGYKVVVAADGAEGIAAYRGRKSEIAAVLTDMKMPGMQGREVVRQLRDINPEVKVVAMSGVFEKDIGVVEEPGSLCFLKKPMTRPQIFRAIRSVLPES